MKLEHDMSQKQFETREENARSRAEEILGTPPEHFSNPLTVLASPAWRGVEGDIWRAAGGARSIILKHFHPDTDFYVDTNAAMEGVEQASLHGLGPNVIEQWPADQMFAMEDLGNEWRAGGLHDATDAEIRTDVIAKKKAFQNTAELSKSSNIFSEIEALLELAIAHDCFTHRDVAIFAEFFEEAQRKLRASDMDSVPCHRDGNTANLMVGPGKSVMLLDFDLVANCDPFEDVGCYLAEFFESEADARIGFEEWHGNFSEGLFQRSMIYGLADDMRWGLIGSIMAKTSPRSALEFSKYAAWRFLRLEAKAKQSDTNNRIRVAI